MPYFVSCIRDGKRRRFAYPHVDIKTAMAVASEVWLTEVSDVWISNEKGEVVVDKAAVLDALDDYEPAEDMEEN